LPLAVGPAINTGASREMPLIWFIGPILVSGGGRGLKPPP
jgi:hypothetical protein